ncbi:MAG: hypothetical protein A2W19_07040 [Spirochaetes bacterium RBG_16_49_21]|nr:MAG: hypothetical protein A2W19_07040 [Spirochaetes bacterium RBG_16_49_21]
MNAVHRILAATVIILTTAVASGELGTAEKLFYIINYTITRCNAEIELNGITVTGSKKEDSFSVTGFADIGIWIRPGSNRLSVVIKPTPRMKDSVFNPGIEVSISTAREGQMSDEGKKIFEYRFPGKDGGESPADIKKPVRKDVAFKPDYIPPSELWDKIKPVKLDSASRKLIITLVKDYHAAFVRKDADALYNLLLFASMDVARLRHRPVEDVKTKMKGALKEMMTEKNFIMAPLNAGRLVLKPVLDGMVIQVTDTAGEAPVRTKATKDSGSYSFPVYAGFIDGKWIIVR